MGEATKQEDEVKAEATKQPEENKKEEKAEEKKEEKPEAEEGKKEETAEEKPEEKKEEQEQEAATAKQPPPLILYVDLHCVGCAKKIEKCILKCRGVEGVDMDMDKNQVTIKGIVEPQALCSMIKKRTMREARILSPLLPAEEGDATKPAVVVSQVSGPTTVELHVNMHCEACAQQLRKKILKMRGVQTAETDLSSGKVTVTGTMDADRLVDYVKRRTRKQARVVPQPPPPKEEEKKEEGGGDKKAEEEKPPEENKKEEAKEEEPKKEGEEKKEPAEGGGGGGDGGDNKKEEKPAGGGGGDGGEQKKEGGGEDAAVNATVVALGDDDMARRMMYWGTPVYVVERLPPPQLFSDENPNACCIS